MCVVKSVASSSLTLFGVFVRFYMLLGVAKEVFGVDFPGFVIVFVPLRVYNMIFILVYTCTLKS